MFCYKPLLEAIGFRHLDRVLWASLQIQLSFITWFPWQNAFASSKQQTFKLTFGIKLTCNLGTACALNVDCLL